MRTSLKKLRGFALLRHERKEQRLQQSLSQLDEVSEASQDMQDMRDCYDGLLSAAAATANSAYEFSESLREMGDCLLEKTALNDDEESGKVLLMLGKVQLELQKLVDSYRSHISQTITVPSESLLNELRIVEEMKRQCDEKRSAYEDMITKYKEKGRCRNNKGEHFSSHQLQAARDEYDEEANLFVFRMKSLKRGQSRSLLTQAARHHAAQMSFFKKALNSLESIEPHVKLVTEQQHIDYPFNGLEDAVGVDTDDDSESDSDYDDYDSDESNVDDGELSFEYRQSDQGPEIPKPQNAMELDNVDLTFPQVAKLDSTKEILDKKRGGNLFAFQRDLTTSSKSAPLFPEKNFDSGERFKPMRQSSTRKLNTYVLPTPGERKSTLSSGPDYSDTTKVPQTRASVVAGTHNMWHSSPLEHKKYEKILGNERLSGPIKTQFILKERENNTMSDRLRTPLNEGHLVGSNTKKIKRQAFSGPLMGKSWTNNPIISASGPIISKGNSHMFSGSLLGRIPLPVPASSPPKSPSTASPTFNSSPKISELHELPRPPPHLAPKSPSKSIRHSAPLVSKSPELSAASKVVVRKANVTSTLPVPPQNISRSYSIPSRDQKEMAVLHVPKPLETPQNLKINVDISSPPLTPISIANS